MRGTAPNHARSFKAGELGECRTALQLQGQDHRYTRIEGTVDGLADRLVVLCLGQHDDVEEDGLRAGRHERIDQCRVFRSERPRPAEGEGHNRRVFRAHGTMNSRSGSCSRGSTRAERLVKAIIIGMSRARKWGPKPPSAGRYVRTRVPRNHVLKSSHRHELEPTEEIRELPETFGGNDHYPAA